MKPLDQCFLYAFVDAAYLHGRSPETVAQQLCDGGADLIQLRAKQTPLAELRGVAERVLEVTRKAGVGLVINDHPGLAAEVGAEFCHLGQEDFFDAGYTQVPVLRREIATFADGTASTLGIGLSTHAPEQAARALAAGADYLAIGPVYATGTKPTAKPVTLGYVRWAAENVKIPWFAIGGINSETIEDVLATGARRVCIVSAILNAPDVAKACREFRQRLVR